jgi:ATP phosphoribosyltransferase
MITIAMPTGRLGEQVFNLLKEANLFSENIKINRQLMIETPKIRLLFVKPSDVITYVVSSRADLGIVGSDLILEEDPSVFDLLDLNIGICQMIVAGLKTQTLTKQETLKVASKYPNITKNYFKNRHQTIELTYLKGSVELAPLIDVSDVVVDITETGTTLKENGLVILDKIHPISSRLIANEASYFLETSAILEIKDSLKKVIT